MKNYKDQSLDLILVPTDYSSPSRAAFLWAAFFAGNFGSKILILHVTPESTAEWMKVAIHDEWNGLVEKEDEWIFEYFKACLNQVFDPAIKIETLIKIGSPPVIIIETATERNASLIIMGSHGRSGIASHVMGSVAYMVIREAPCPVFVIKNEPFSRTCLEKALKKTVTSF